MKIRAGALGAVSLATLVWVQAGVAAAAEIMPSGPASVDEVVVTAQRRAEKLEDVPIAINTASGASLERQGITRLEDISRIAPAVLLSRTGIYNQPAIRGITSQGNNVPENNVAIYVDGFYQASTRSLNMDLANLSQVQVLKGPQGTLFGRNATGGAILVETLQPSMTERSGRIMVGYGNYNDRRVQAYFSTPISDKVAVNIAGSLRKTDGYIKDVSGFDTAPLDNYSINAKIRLEASDKLTITAGYTNAQVSDGRSQAGTTEGRSLAKVLFPASYVETRDNRTSLNHPVEDIARQHSGSLKVAYDLGWGMLTSLSYYQKDRDYTHFEADGSPQPVYDQFLHENYRTSSQEFNLASTNDSRLQYVVGMFFFDQRIIQYDNFARAFPSTVFVKQTTYIQQKEAYAGYADATYRVTDRLFLTGGLRYSHEKRTQDSFTGAGVYRGQQAANYTSTTPRFVIRYEVADNTNAYASFTKGFKSGDINVNLPFAVIKPEKITAYEVGFKTAQSRFRFDTSAYYYDYKDLQVSSSVTVNGTLSAVTTNAATARIYGAEAQLSGHLTDNLNVGAGLAYTHARYRTFTGAVVNVANASGLNSSQCANPNAPPATILCTQDWSGKRIPRAPDWSGNINADYTVPLAYGEIVLTGNVTYQSFYIPQKGDLDAAGRYRLGQPGYALVNLGAAWTSPDKTIKFTVYGNNIGDKRYYLIHNVSAFYDVHMLAEPRTYGARIEYNF